MNSITASIAPRLAGASVAASAALALQAAPQLTDEQSSESTAVGIEHVGLAAWRCSRSSRTSGGSGAVPPAIHRATRA